MAGGEPEGGLKENNLGAGAEAGMGSTPWGKTNSLKDLSKGTFLLECGGKH